MKKLILLVLLSTSIFANTLIDQQESRVLREIDNMCGDSWCEGEFNYDFDSLECNAETNSCVLTFSLLLIEWSEDKGDHLVDKFDTSCIVKGYTKFDEMIEISRQGWDQLKTDFYEVISECVTEEEDKFFKKLGW